MVKLRRLAAEADQDTSEAFLGFCERLCAVKGPNIATPYTYGTVVSNGVLYGYTTRAFVTGVALADLERPLDEDSVVRAGLQIARGLDAMHLAGIQHHDLKLENVIVKRAAGNVIDRLTQCLLIDISFRAETDQASLTEVTLQYLAPELLAGDPSDARVDLYSLGVLLYALRAGRLPFVGDSVGEIIRSQRNRDYTSLADVSPSSSDLVRIVERLLDPYPDNRYESAQEVIAALADCVPNPGNAGFSFQGVGGFVGRSRELNECLDAMAFDGERGVSCIEVSGSARTGVTSLLREVQDRAEALGCVVLTARPRSLHGQSIQAQLALPIHALVRQDDREVESQTLERRVAESTTDLLDDVYVAASGRRLAIFVDDWRACDVSELSFLQRAVMQDQAAEKERLREGGRCQVILGTSDTRSPKSPVVKLVDSLVQSRVRLSLWTSDDLKSLVRQSSPDNTLGNAVCQRIVQAAGGRPGDAIAILSSLSPSDAGLDLRRAVENAIGRSVGRHAAESQMDAEIDHLLAEPQGQAQLALAIWGEPLPLDAWECLLGPRDATQNLVAVRELPDAVQTTSPHLGQYVCRQSARTDLDGVFACLANAMKVLWRSRCVETLTATLRCYCRLGGARREDVWKVCRALMVLLRHGRFADVENAAGQLAQSVEPSRMQKWLRYLEIGARVEAGSATEALDLPQPDSEALRRYGSWIHARAMWRARHRSAAFKMIESELDGDEVVGAAMLEDVSLLAAELKHRDVARRFARLLLARLLRAQSMAPNGHDRLDRLRARVFRVRQRRLLAARRFRAASVAARRERIIHETSGNGFGVAAGLNNEGVALLKAGAMNEAIEKLDRCMRLREKSDDERGLVVVLNNLALAHSLLAEPGNAAAALNRARVIASRNGLTRHSQLSSLNLALAYLSVGQLREARTVFTRLINRSKQAGDKDIRGNALLNYATLAADEWHMSVATRVLNELSAMGLEQFEPSALGLDIEIAIRTHEFKRADTKIQAADERGHSSVCTDAKCLLEARRDGRRPPREASLTARIRSGAAVRVALGKKISNNSLARIRRLARRDVSTRVELEWVVAYLAQAPSTEVSVSIGWEAAGRSEFREGHDDLQIEMRAYLGRILRHQGRTQEAWAVLTDALKRFRRLERKLQRWRGPSHVVEHLYGVLCNAMGIRARALGSRRHHSTLLQSEAFVALASRHSETGRESLIRGLGEALALAHVPDEALDRILSLSLEATGAHRALVVIAKGNERRIRRYRLAEGASGEGGNAELSWAVLSTVLSTGIPQIYGDALGAEQLSSHRSIAVLNLRSLACVPLQGAQGVIGALYLDHHGMAGLFGEEDLGVLTLLANVIALTLESAEMRNLAETWEERLAEAHRQVVRGERNRLTGQIASGMAHDLKNILTTIVARSQLMMHRKSGTSDARALKSIEKAAHTAASMIEKLQECSREHVMQRGEAVDLGGLAHEAVELLAPRFAADTGINVDVDADPGIIMQGVAGELRELFLNLILNACDAMPDGGDLKISVKHLEGAEKATVTVSDTGVGMPEEVRARIFEPFFTTKGNAGTGLGLAVVRSAVVRYAGDLVVESVQGEGTTFTVTFPVAATDSGAFPKSKMTKESPDR